MSRTLAPYLRDLLESSGLEWSVETGKKHRKVLLLGRVVLVVPFTEKRSSWQQQRNAVAALRRAIREAQSAQETRP